MLRTWIVGAGAWLVLALITAAQNYAFAAWIGRPIDAWMAVWRELVMFGAWAVITPPIVVVTMWARRSRVARLAHVPACVMASVAHSAIIVASRFVIDGAERQPPFGDQLVVMLGRYFILDIVFYAAVVGVVEATVWSRLARDLARARLDALRGQLQPHFLFNSLHAASSLIDSDPVAARRTIVRLSDLLRATMEIDRPVVSLGEELELLDRYVDIQRVRFHDRLRVEVDVPEELRVAAVPPLLLQPLVENAIKHGIGTRTEAGTIRISATREGGRLRIVVADDGAGLSRDHGERVGLGTTRARLAALHGDRASVELHAGEQRGVDAVIELPWSVVA